MDRDEISFIFETLFPSWNRYYRPPNNLVLNTPYILYTEKGVDADYANNETYGVARSFQATFVSNLPGGLNTAEVLKIQGAVHNSSYVSNDLVHDVFTITAK